MEGAPEDDRFAKVSDLKLVAKNIADVIEPLLKRSYAAEAMPHFSSAALVGPIVKGIYGVLRADQDRSLEAIGSRVSSVEFKCGALAMNMARSPEQRTELASVETLLQRIAELESRLERMERE